MVPLVRKKEIKFPYKKEPEKLWLGDQSSGLQTEGSRFDSPMILLFSKFFSLFFFSFFFYLLFFYLFFNLLSPCAISCSFLLSYSSFKSGLKYCICMHICLVLGLGANRFNFKST